MVETASTIVAVFGFLILGASCWGMATPNRVLLTVDSLMASGAGMFAAIGSRVILGVALIVAAPGSWTPRVFIAVGLLSLLAAVLLPFIGRENIVKLLTSIRRWPVLAVRGWFLIGIAAGAYLIYAVVI